MNIYFLKSRTLAMRKEWNNIMLLDGVTKEFSEKENN